MTTLALVQTLGPTSNPEVVRECAMPTVAMVGGGQLARMTHQAAIALGQTLRVLAQRPNDPAAQVSPDVLIGNHDRIEDLRAAADGATALTFDHEQVPTDLLDELVKAGVNVQPPPQALQFAQDKIAMRRRLAELDAPIPQWSVVNSLEDVTSFAEAHGWPVVLKAARGGYDGRGVWVVDSADEAAQVVAGAAAAGSQLLAEELVGMRRELSAMVARSPYGQGASWPVVETVQRNGQCAVVIAPAPNLSDEFATQAKSIALRIAAELGVVGALAVELFETTSGELLINELAMRPHNSGHWTMDGARTSQFEQHLRGVLDYPLGDTSAIAPVTVMANVLGAEVEPTMSMDERLHHLFARIPEVHVHMYGKLERPDRKIGHVNVLGALDGSVDDPQYVATVRARAEAAARWLSHAEWTLEGDQSGEE